MSRIRCRCGELAIGVVIIGGKSILVCQACYRAECVATAERARAGREAA